VLTGPSELPWGAHMAHNLKTIQSDAEFRKETAATKFVSSGLYLAMSHC